MKSAYREGKMEGIAEGEIKGELKGKLEKAIETARKMRAEGLNFEQIIRISGLSEDELKENGIL